MGSQLLDCFPSPAPANNGPKSCFSSLLCDSKLCTQFEVAIAEISRDFQVLLFLFPSFSIHPGRATESSGQLLLGRVGSRINLYDQVLAVYNLHVLHCNTQYSTQSEKNS